MKVGPMEKGRNSEEQKLIEKMYEHNQEHILRFWGELNNDEKDLLIRDMNSVDFAVLDEAAIIRDRKIDRERNVEPPVIVPVAQSEDQIKKEKEAGQAGTSYIESSRTAVFTAAGGQSSRLGLESPKGTYPVSPIMEKSLFQVHAEKILYFQNKFKVKIPWVIMVSETNRDQTVDFFEKNSYFGLDKNYMSFIVQGMFPAVDRDGKIFLKDKFRVFLNPSGHGGTFSALKESGKIKWLKGLGVEEIFYFQVDNVLAKILDPVFIGYHTEKKCGISSKSVQKRDPGEKVGVFALENAKTTVVEYSEFSTLRVKGGKDPAESLTSGNIAIHMINTDFAERKGTDRHRLPLHLAFKAVPHIDNTGNPVKPEKPNGYKIETFIFDALKDSDESVIMDVLRESEFSPLKNKTGNESPETVFTDQLKFFAGWFEGAGITVPTETDGTPSHKLEVSPCFAAFKEDFIKKIDKNIVIDRDTYIE
jgi:UDP-N-acetylglucosamine/UDP-N-acetylgalactosamine diphosphorylase